MRQKGERQQNIEPLVGHADLPENLPGASNDGAPVPDFYPKHAFQNTNSKSTITRDRMFDTAKESNSAFLILQRQINGPQTKISLSSNTLDEQFSRTFEPNKDAKGKEAKLEAT